MKRRSLRIGALSIGVSTLVAVATFACSNSNTGTSANASSSSNFITSYCSYIGSCCGSQSLPSDGSQCRELLGFEVNGSAYDPAQGQACLNAVSSAASSDPAWCVDQQATTNTACNGAFGKTSGNVQPGGTCTSDSDCAAAPSGDGVFCRSYFGNGGAQTQICQVETHGKAGDGPCLGNVQVVNGTTETDTFGTAPDAGAPSQGIYCFSADGVTCDDIDTHTCVALGQIGDACGSGCVTGAYCGTDAKCVASAATGAACTTTANCVTGDYCNSSAGNTCTLQVGSNQACTSSDECTSGDCTNGKCGAGLAGLTLAILCGGGDGG